jgi:hypothetical protein
MKTVDDAFQGRTASFRILGTRKASAMANANASRIGRRPLRSTRRAPTMAVKPSAAPIAHRKATSVVKMRTGPRSR